jgi:F-type H+-transporting ATPase subunit delta
MRSQILVKRYTQGLANAIKSREEFETISGELADFLSLLSAHKELKGFLFSFFLTTDKKAQIVKEILAKKSVHEKTSRFLLLLVVHNRLELLGDILDQLPVVWNEKQGVLTFEVSSVVPMTAAQKEKLQRELELVEKSSVRLNFKIDPELVGGLYLRRANTAYDDSIRGHLTKLKEKISEG